LAEIVSRVLEPEERDVVRGDLVELRETGLQALRDVLGLVGRRQVALWGSWQPWLVLIGLIVPIGLLLSLVSNRVAHVSSVYSWMYFNNWDWALLQHRAFWITLAQTIELLSPGALALLCLSWAAGFMLGTLSRRTLPVNGALFCFVLLFGEFVAVPRYLEFQLNFFQNTLGQDIHLHENDPVSSLMFYKIVFPLLVQIVLVLLPAVWGMYKSFRGTAVPLLLRTILFAPALAILAVLAATQAIWWIAVTTDNGVWLRQSWQTPPLLFAAAGPIIYAAASVWKRWRTAKPCSPGI
jgi:hypothetical protein